jgi:hypothetical protein
MTEQSFIDYWDALDDALMRLYGIHTGDTGLEPDIIAGAQEQGDTPEDLALAHGEKYGLTLFSESRANWGRS